MCADDADPNHDYPSTGFYNWIFITEEYRDN